MSTVTPERGQMIQEKTVSEEFEEYIYSFYGGEKHVTFSHGERGVHYKDGFTVPDIVRKIGMRYEAIECKSVSSLSNIANILYRQIYNRCIHLPIGYRQRIIFEDLGFSDETKQKVIEDIQRKLEYIYPGIPVDFIKKG